MRGLAIVFGSILLLPGVCSLGSMALLGFDREFVLLWLVCFAISAVGFIVILKALQEPELAPDSEPKSADPAVPGPEAGPRDRRPGGDDLR